MTREEIKIWMDMDKLKKDYGVWKFDEKGVNQDKPALGLPAHSTTGNDGPLPFLTG